MKYEVFESKLKTHVGHRPVRVGGSIKTCLKLKSILLTFFALVSISSVSFAQPQGKQSYNCLIRNSE